MGLSLYYCFTGVGFFKYLFRPVAPWQPSLERHDGTIITTRFKIRKQIGRLGYIIRPSWDRNQFLISPRSGELTWNYTLSPLVLKSDNLIKLWSPLVLPKKLDFNSKEKWCRIPISLFNLNSYPPEITLQFTNSYCWTSIILRNSHLVYNI